jgi:hypothetical protein
MNLDKFVKSKGYQHSCPFCGTDLISIDDPYFGNRGQKGYACEVCFIEGVLTKSGKPFSRYNIGVVENVDVGPHRILEQLIVDETFYIHHKENKWYNVHNDMVKSQTVMVLTEPMNESHIFYAGEIPIGLVWISDLVVLPYIDSWTLTDEAATISKIRTYLTFM